MHIRLLLPLVAFAILCIAHTAHAQVHRCLGADGELVFTDQPCGTQEQSLDAANYANGVAPAASGGVTGIDTVQLAATGCPSSPQALRDRIALAFNSDDPNALAGLIDWRGYDRSSANARLREFKRWLQQPLAGIQFDGATDPSGAQPGDADYAAPNPTGITVLTQPRGDDVPSSRSFGVMRRGGCWWLSF